MIRIGLGYDIHRLRPGRRLVLGGIEIPSDLGLDGHSDADVLLHALMDALLGALALGDIGQHFPPSDERYRDISSLALLAHVRDLLFHQGYRVVNADMMLIAERPRISPHVPRMRERIAGVLGVSQGAISIKATTNEEMGPEGRREAMSAQAVVLLEQAP